MPSGGDRPRKNSCAVSKVQPQALKAPTEFQRFTARINSCPSLSVCSKNNSYASLIGVRQIFSAASGAVPFPSAYETSLIIFGSLARWDPFCTLSAFFHLAIELFGLAAGDAERFPVGGAKVFRQENDLSDVVGVVGQLPVDGLQDGMGF